MSRLAGGDVIRAILARLSVRIVIMAMLLGAACILTSYYHAVLRTGAVFSHLFYIPIILGAFWWKRKGLLVAVFLAAMLIASNVFIRQGVGTNSDFYRSGMFLVVSVIAVVLSERIAQREEALRQTGDYTRHLLESSPDFQMTLDKNGRIMDVNEAFEAVVGRSRQDVVGTSIYEYFPKDPAERAFAEVFRKKMVRDIEIPAKMPGKEDFICNLSGTVFGRPEGEPGVYVTGRDITERKRMEEEARKFAEQLEQANIHLQEMDRLKSVFLASMSHELRTPLNSIIGFTGIILMGIAGDINEEQRRQLAMVKNSADHLLSLINDILDISKIEADKVELSLEEFGLDDVVGEVIGSLSPGAGEKGLEVLTEIPEGITLFSDRRRIKQVLMNLVSNAIKFTDQGYVRIAAGVSEHDNLELRVIDTGVGIRKKDMDRLFQPFQQVGPSLTKKQEGTGLGLHLAEKLARLLQGDILAKSEYGKGSEFTLVIPLRYEENRNEEDTAG